MMMDRSRNSNRAFPLITEDARVSAALWALSLVLFEITQTSDPGVADKENQVYSDSHLGEENE
jgi:hypothetical protein